MSTKLRFKRLAWAAACLGLTSSFSAHAAYPSDAACQVAQVGLTLSPMAFGNLCTFTQSIEVSASVHHLSNGQLAVSEVTTDKLTLTYTDTLGFASAGSSGLGSVETASVIISPARLQVDLAQGRSLTSVTATAFWDGSLSGSARILGPGGLEVVGDGGVVDLTNQTVSWSVPIDAETGGIRIEDFSALTVFAPYASRGSVTLQRVEFVFMSSPVPEPQSVAMALCGLLVAGVGLRGASRRD